MRVVADSHSLLFYLFTPAQLSERALDALVEGREQRWGSGATGAVEVIW